jgi:hypothetical protein
MANTRQPHHPDDIVVWPDGTWATFEDVCRGDFVWMSDDYEIVGQHDVVRLKALGLAVDFDLS